LFQSNQLSSSKENDMSTTTTSPAPVAAVASVSRGTHRLMAAGGAAFATIVAAQNVIRGAGAPLNDASVTDVLEHYRDATGLTLLLTAMFVVGGFCLAGFVAEIGRRLFRRGAGLWASVGVIGAVGVIVTFSLVVGIESALVGAAGREHPDLGTIDALWLTHNAVFSILDLVLAVALLGLARAAVTTGIAPGLFRWLAPLGAAGLAFAAAATPVIADGSAMAAQGPALAGFVIWLLFLFTTSVRMIRES
jgi:hypothetical protein